MGIELNIIRFVISSFMLVCLVIVFLIVWTMPDLLRNVNVPKFCLFYPNNDLICGDETQVLLGLLKQETEENYRKVSNDYEQDKISEGLTDLKHYFRGYKHNIKPAVRLTGSYESEFMQDIVEQGIQNKEDPHHLKSVKLWTKNKHIVQSGGFRRYGVVIKNGRIVVPVSGHYEVYSLINFQEECIEGRSKQNATCPIMHAVFKYDISEGKEVKIMESVQPHKVSQHKDVNTYASYISSMVALKAGDELSLKVNHLSYLRYPDINYFGAHLI